MNPPATDVSADWTAPAAPARPSPAASGWKANRATVLWAWLACALASALMGLLNGSPPLGLGPDGDDTLRFVQLRALLEGQGWFDLTLPRLGAGGTELHWSRLADLPYLLIAGPLSPFLGAERALLVAGTLVPGLLSGLFALGLLRGMSALAAPAEGRDTPLPGVAVLVAAILILAFPPRFGMGAFDHHHLQIGLLAVAVGFTLVRDPSRRDAAVVALSVVASAAIGLESAPLLVGVCAVWALRWALSAQSRGATTVFGVALTIAAALAFLVTPMEAWTRPVCDAYGPPVAGLFMLGGAGLALGARLAEGRGLRLATLAGLGAVALASLRLGAPDCLGNPMDTLPVEVREGWLRNVVEARPLTHIEFSWAERVRMGAVPLIGAGVALVWGMRARRARTTWWALALATLAALALTLYQARFYTFATVLAAFALGSLLVRILTWEARSDGRPVGPALRLPALLLALVGSSGAALGGLASLASPGAPPTYAPCQGATEALSQLPPGRVWGDLDHAPHILRATTHTAVAGNYHRGDGDIADWLVLAATPPSDAWASLRAAGVDYVLACESGVAETLYGARYPAGLMAALGTGAGVPGLIEIAPAADPRLRVLAVVPADDPGRYQPSE